MSGLWVMVCGPSGAGKDSVLAWAARELATHRRICFARRMVTRPAQEGSEHDEVTLTEVETMRRRAELAWHWQAHGQHYAIHADYARQVADGTIVVVNGSREHARPLAGRADVRCVLVTAASGLLQERLQSRGREDAQALALRIARNAVLAAPPAERVIVNNGKLEAAGIALRDYLLDLAE